jgi:hypothetical protein
VAEIGIALLLFVVVRARLGIATARAAVAFYWLNPAALFDASILGYLDAQYILPALASLAAAAAGWPGIAGGLIAASILTKAQGVFIAPAVALAIWSVRPEKRPTNLLSAALGGVVIALAVVAPIVVAGGWANMTQALGRLATHDMLSANAPNLWWVIGYLLRAWYSMHDMGVWPALTAPAKILGIQRVIEIGYPDPRTIGIVLTLAAIAWCCWVARGARDVWMMAAAGGFTVHAYATLSAQVHENHLFAAVPLLVLAAAGRAAFRPIAVGVSAVVALNLNLFYGFGDGIGWALPRGITVVDLTVILALFNCFLLLWYAWILRRECSTAAARPPQPAPA